MSALNKMIAKNLFMSLILDYDIPAAGGLPPYVSCRVLNDGYYFGYITAETKEEAIKKFLAGEIKTK